MKPFSRLLLCTTAAALTLPLSAEPDVLTFGGFPFSGTPYPLTSAVDGNIYGLTYLFNGSTGVFRVSPDGAYKVIRSYPRVLVGAVANKTGSVPASDVTLASDNYVYGLTATGGLTARGVLYRMRPDGTDYNAVDLDQSGLASSVGTFPAPSSQLIEGVDLAFYSISGSGAIIRIGRDGLSTRVAQKDGTVAVLRDAANPAEVVIVSQKVTELRVQRVNLTTGADVGALQTAALPTANAVTALKWTPSGLVYYQDVASGSTGATVGNFSRLNAADGTVTALSSVTTNETPRGRAQTRTLAVLDDGTVYFSAGFTDSASYGHTILALLPGSGVKRIIAGFPDTYAVSLLKGPGDGFYGATTGTGILLPHDDSNTWNPDWMARGNSNRYDYVATPLNRGTFFQLSPSGVSLNAPPVATLDLGKTRGANGLVFSPLKNDRDPDGNAFSLVDAGPGTTGAVTANGATVTFVPLDAGYASSIVPYRIADTAGATSTGTILVHGNPAGKYIDPAQIVRKQAFSITAAATGRFSAIIPDGYGAYVAVAGNLDARDTGVATARTRNGNLVRLSLTLVTGGGAKPAFHYTISTGAGTPLTGVAVRK